MAHVLCLLDSTAHTALEMSVLGFKLRGFPLYKTGRQQGLRMGQFPLYVCMMYVRMYAGMYLEREKEHKPGMGVGKDKQTPH